MITIGLKFITGRFHANPWGHHVNEGTPEWPPSSWRLLRCMISTWKTKLDEMATEDVEAILRLLAEPPEYALPEASIGHSRHYMPWFKKGPSDKTLAFDSFVALTEASEVLFFWPDAVLPPNLKTILRIWLEHLGYLGRAESWCDARLIEDPENIYSKVNCRPLESTASGSEMEVVRVLCVDGETAFQNQFTPKTETVSGRGKYRQTVSQAHYDPDWHICGETLWLHKERWSDPPGSQWVRYGRSSDCFKIVPNACRPKRHTMRPQVARFSLDSAVLPLLIDTLPVAETARRVLMGIFGRQAEQRTGNRSVSPIFSGKDDNGDPLQNHGHSYFLPTDEDNDGRLDHLTLVALDGFGDLERVAIDKLRELKSRERDISGHPLRVLLTGLGRLDEFKPGPLRPSSTGLWRSATPFLVPRHPKARGTKRDSPELLASPVNFLAFMLREELKNLVDCRSDLSQLQAENTEITPMIDKAGVFRIGRHCDGPRPLQFKRYRQKANDDGGRRLAGTFCINLGKDICGPISLGHSSHFGLGLFVPHDNMT